MTCVIESEGSRYSLSFEVRVRLPGGTDVPLIKFVCNVECGVGGNVIGVIKKNILRCIGYMERMKNERVTKRIYIQLILK